MSEFDPRRSINNNSDNAWNKVEAMARGYNKSVPTENRERAELNRRTIEAISNSKRASKTFKKLASGALISVMLFATGLTMGITAGNVVVEQAKAEQLDKVTNNITAFIDDDGENKPWKICTQPIDKDGVINYEKTIYHDNCNIDDKEAFREQLGTLELERSEGVTVEWMSEDNKYVYRATDKGGDGNTNIIERVNVDATWDSSYYMADDKTGEEIPWSWSTMSGVEQYFAKHDTAE